MKEKLIKVNETHLWTKLEGTGYPILLISGGPGCSDYMEPVASLLKDRYTVIRFDARGCGRSEYCSEADLSTAISDLEAIRKEYRFEEWIVIGHSWGADLALAYSLKHSSVVTGLVYMCGTGIQRDIDWKEAYQRGKEENLEEAPIFEYSFNNNIKRTLLTSWREFIKKPSLMKDISELPTKILFITGGKDIRPAWPVEQIAQLIRNSKFEVVEGAGHYIWLTHANQLKILLSTHIRDLFRVTMYEPADEDIAVQRSMLDEQREPFVIRFFFNNKSTLYGFVAYGETGFTQYGLDIIAAGVSTLIINTIHSLNHLTKDNVEADMQRNYSKCILPDLHMKNRGSIEAISLLKSLEIGIHSIQNTYGENHITIEEIFEEQKAGLFKIFK